MAAGKSNGSYGWAVNFGERDKWWGLMVDGFNEEPMYGISFNPRYYQQLFEAFGFKNYYNQYYYTLEAYGTLAISTGNDMQSLLRSPITPPGILIKDNFPSLRKIFLPFTILRGRNTMKEKK
jgi:hypothetical protein